MAKWHLTNPLGQSERTTDAETLFWARRRFAPIPKGWHVISDASYRTPAYQVKPDLIDRCSKCNRNPAVEGMQQCHDCAAHKRRAYRKQHGLDPLAPVKEWKERRFTLAEMDLRPAEQVGKLMRTSEAAKRLGVKTNSVNAIMKSHGFAPVAGYAPKIRRAGRTERQWVAAEVEVVFGKRLSRAGAQTNMTNGIERRRTKRLQLSLGF
jgi:hypothetical protein